MVNFPPLPGFYCFIIYDNGDLKRKKNCEETGIFCPPLKKALSDGIENCIRKCNFVLRINSIF